MNPFFNLAYNLERLDMELCDLLSVDVMTSFEPRFFYIYKKLLETGMESYEMLVLDWEDYSDAYHCRQVAENMQQHIARFITNYRNE